RGERAVALGEALAAHGVERDVDAAPVRDPLHRRLEVFLRVIDAVSDAELAEARVLRAARRADDLGALGAADLERGLPDAARDGVDEHLVASAHVAEV